jgi:hypothetical protein
MLRSKLGMGKTNQLLVKAERKQTNRPSPSPCKKNYGRKREKVRSSDLEGERGNGAGREKGAFLRSRGGRGTTFYRIEHKRKISK